MFQVKVTPDNGRRYVVTVTRDKLAGVLKELSDHMGRGLVVFVSVTPVWEEVGE